jgi:molybdenum cofactor cytidylyltransferase
MGQLKQTLPWGDGQTLLSSVVAGLRASAVSEVVVVTGQARAEVEACLAEVGAGPGPALRFAFNSDFAATEMARSLQVGLAALPANCQAALVALADQPDLEPGVVAQVIQRWRQTRAAVVAPFYHGQRGHPLLFDRSLWPAIHALPPSANPRAVLPAAGTVEQVAVDSAAVLRDIDTPEDYARARAPQGQDR